MVDWFDWKTQKNSWDDVLRSGHVPGGRGRPLGVNRPKIQGGGRGDLIARTPIGTFWHKKRPVRHGRGDVPGDGVGGV